MESKAAGKANPHRPEIHKLNAALYFEETAIAFPLGLGWLPVARLCEGSVWIYST
jgi:hypothetical protein